MVMSHRIQVFKSKGIRFSLYKRRNHFYMIESPIAVEVVSKLELCSQV
jgi:hypothetical protein